MKEAISVAEAEKQLTLAKAQQTAISELCKELETFISLGKRLAVRSSIGALASVPTPESRGQKQVRTQKSQQPIPIRSQGGDMCDNARQAFIKLDRNANVPEIIALMQQLGTPVTGDFPRQNLRSMFKRRSDVFENLGSALFALREWPSEKKYGKQAKVQ